MRRNLARSFILLLAVLAYSLVTAGQSLGDAAREARKNKPAKSATHVYDNTNLPGAGGINVVGGDASTSAPRADKPKAGGSDAGTPAQLSPSELAEDWRKRIAEQKKKVARLEEELVPMEKEYKRLESECAWKECRVFAGTSGMWITYNDDPKDAAYLAARERIEAKRKQLSDAKQKLDAMVEQASRETGKR